MFYSQSHFIKFADNFDRRLKHHDVRVISEDCLRYDFFGALVNLGSKTESFILEFPHPHNGFKNREIDFVQYDWNRKRFNKVREGDYFIYRRPQKVSENKKFYFFGTGRVGKITDYDDRVICDVEKPIRFKNIIYQDDIVDYQWKWKSKTKNDFQQFFNNYGMNTIPFEDLEHFFKLGVG